MSLFQIKECAYIEQPSNTIKADTMACFGSNRGVQGPQTSLSDQNDTQIASKKNV